MVFGLYNIYNWYNVIGYLKNGYTTWQEAGKPEDLISTITAKEFAEKLLNNGTELNVLDVRKPSEYEDRHLQDIANYPLDYINNWTNSLDKTKTYYVHCAGGYRSAITESILKSRNIHNVIDVAGGYGAIKTELQSDNIN